MREDGPSRGSVMIKTIRRYREVQSDPMQRQGTEPAPWLTPLSFQYPRADAETPPLRLLSQVTYLCLAVARMMTYSFMYAEETREGA